MTNVAQTSRQAYLVVPKETRRQQVLKCLRFSGEYDMTNMELSRALNWDINRITPRVLELRRKGFVAHSCERPCRITGEVVNAWRLAE
jgi:hypothetical protein